MFKNKKIFSSVLFSLFLSGVLNITPVFAQDTNIISSRLSGTNRYTTSVEISKVGWPKANTVIIATGLGYADALAASSLSKLNDAPILLTEKNSLNQNILTEIKRLNATKAILVGGTKVIAPDIEKQLKNLQITVTRIGGTDRYDTSKKVAETMGTDNGIIMATGLDFPDALSIAPIAGIKSIPILLTPKKSMTLSISEFISSQNIPVSYIVGGTSVIANSVVASLPNRTRISGANRFETNVVVNKNFANDLNFDTIYLATGSDFPDALAGSALAAKNNAPIFLVSKDSISLEAISLIQSKNVKRIVILGGTNVISKTIANVVIKSVSLLKQELKSKGGVIGTTGKGVVSLRFDDYQNVFGEKVYPMLLARGLPASMALISRFNTSFAWGIDSTWDQVRTWNRNGIEMWSHGTDHRDYSASGYDGLYSQIVTSKAEIEAQNIKVVGWALPGVPASTSNIPYNRLFKPSDYNGVVGNLIMQTYALSEAYAYSPIRVLPTTVYHGLNHYTISDGWETVSSSKEAINVAINDKSGVELMIHAGNLGKPFKMSYSDFEDVLDYIKTKWDDGSIEVLTPSGLFFADPNSTNRLKLTSDESFEELTVDNPGAWSKISELTGNTIETTGGRSGANFLRIDSNITSSPVTQKIISLDKLKVSGEQFVFEGWFRQNGEGNTNGMVQIDDPNNPSGHKIIKKVVSNGSSWTKLQFVFSVPPNAYAIKLSLSRISGSGIDWDDIIIKKI